MEKLLFESSVEGNVAALIMLLQEDPLILDRITLNRYGNTPLHVASMLGHVDFVKEILIRKPYLTMETDSQRRLPLHIASAKGHMELVRLMLSAIRSSEACIAISVSHIGANTVYKWLYMLEYPLSPQGLFWRDSFWTSHILTWYQSRRFVPPWPSTSLFRLIESPALRGSVSFPHIGANTVYKWLYMLEYPLSPQGLFWRDNLGAPHILTLACDCDGRNPLHIAAIKGRFDVVKELVQPQPQAAKAMVQHDTILHLCVLHNQPEIMKFLIESAYAHEYVNSKDSYGNNILHLAVVHRQIETINFLLLNTSIDVNTSNANGETPMDILAQGPRDLKYQKILRSLIGAGAVQAQMSGIEISLDRFDNNTKQTMVSHLKLKETSRNYDDWLDRKRNSLMVVASLIATMAFQAGTNPPGGLWQDNLPTDPLHKIGYAVMVSNEPSFYRAFLVCNTVGYVSTLSIILLLISGLPFLKHGLVMWILMVIMWISVTSMSLTYLVSIFVWLPEPESTEIREVAVGIVLAWMGLMSLIVVAHIIRLIVITVRLIIPLVVIGMRWFRQLLFPSKRPILRPVIMECDI